ncbi:hypothetical protein RB653_002290 [Dictyostelium firmibasis]|uniref:Rho-GAP domain-containing protein n=1 Tax=Dictyostelium firmibasis TaxID=79012 RepID=A0AAN7TQD5_9MYCE
MNIKSLRKKTIQNMDQEEVYNRIKENVAHMDEIQKTMEKQQQTFFQMSQQSKQIAESMKKYSMDAAYFNSRIPITDCLSRASEWQNSISEVFNHLGNLLYDRTTQPLRQTINIQLEMVKDGKKKLKNLSTDAGKSSSANFKKDTEALERTQKETLQLYNDSELALENSTVQTILSSFESYNDFFQRGVFQMTKIKSDIDNYKKIILETNKVAAKLRNYVPKKTFGIKLEEVFARESNKPLPGFLDEIFRYLEKESIHVEGMFRVSGGKSSVEALQQKIESGAPLELNGSTIIDPHSVSSVLKLFLRSLPESLVLYNVYSKYLSVAKNSGSNSNLSVVGGNGTIIKELKRLISTLPVCNQALLKQVLLICSLMNQHRDVTKMDLTNLSVVIGPSILEPIPNLKAEDIQRPETFADFNLLFCLLVEHVSNIFPQVSQTSMDMANLPTTVGKLRSQTDISSQTKPLPSLPTSPQNRSAIITGDSSSPSLNTPIKSSLNSSDFVIVDNNSNNNSISNNNNNNNNNSNSSNNTTNNGNGIPGTATPPPPTTPTSNSIPTPTINISGCNNNNNTTKRTTNKSNIKIDDYLTPIDMQIYYINISSNLGRIKSFVDDIETVNQGIGLIKLFKKISDEHMAPIKNALNYVFKKEKPPMSNDEDKVLRIKRTLFYTYEITMELISEANNTFESSSIEEPTELSKKLEESFKQLDAVLTEELLNIDKQQQQADAGSGISSNTNTSISGDNSENGDSLNSSTSNQSPLNSSAILTQLSNQ